MTEKELFSLLERLQHESNKTEWLEFKDSLYDPEEIEEYLSALSNGACLAGKPRGYFVFGIKDGSHDVVGTHFDPFREKGKGNQGLIMWLSMGLQPNVGFVIHQLNHPQGNVIIFEIVPAWDRPVTFSGKAFIRIGSRRGDFRRYRYRCASESS